MRLANGTGGVHKLPGKRRNPWRARITTGWEVNEEGKSIQKFKTVGYYPTKNDAMLALLEYNKNPYDLDANTITFAEVYEKWSEAHFPTLVPSAIRSWRAAYNHSAPLHNMRFRDIRVAHLEGAIQNADVGQCTKQRMKSLYNLMYKYALKHEIVDKDYAQMCDSIKRGKPTIERVPFSTEEIRKLWDNLNKEWADMVLIGIYSGWRPQELSVLKITDVDVENGFMFGGLKTDAGRNRYVPIHKDILPLIRKRYEQAVAMGSDYLFNDEFGQQGTYMTYDKYRSRFAKIMKRLGMSHRPHDTRHTFITIAKECQMNEYILKMIVGHEISDVTERVYTHRTLEELQREMEKFHVDM